MSQAARQVVSPVATTEVIDPITVVTASDVSSKDSHRLENGPSSESDVDSNRKKTVKEKIKSPKNSPDSGELNRILIKLD